MPDDAGYVSKGFIAALLGALAEPVLSAAYNAAVAGIELAGADKPLSHQAHVNLASDNGTMDRCLQFVKGRFRQEGDQIDTPWKDDDEPLRNSLAEIGLYLSEKPDMLIEFVRFNAQKFSSAEQPVGALSYGISRLIYNNSGISGIGTSQRDIVVLLQLQAVDKADGKVKTVPETINLGSFAPGTDLDFVHPLNLTAAQDLEIDSDIKVEDEKETETEDDTKYYRLNGPGTKWMTQLVGDTPVPYTIDITVTETRKGSEFAKKLAEKLGSDDVQKAVIAAVTPTSADIKKANLDTFATSYSNAVAAWRACEAEPLKDKPVADRIAAITLAERNIRQANFDAAKADKDAPFSEFPELAKIVSKAKNDEDYACEPLESAFANQKAESGEVQQSAQ